MAVSVIISTAVFIYFRSLACGVASFLAGILLDLDHALDYYLNYGCFSLKNFYNYCLEIRFERLSLIFHSYELIIILWGSILVFSLGDIWKAIAIGATQHIIFDQLTNVPRDNMDKLGYFFIFRLKNRFKKEAFIKGR